VPILPGDIIKLPQRYFLTFPPTRAGISANPLSVTDPIFRNPTFDRELVDLPAPLRWREFNLL
jgi:hypothetical protein